MPPIPGEVNKFQLIDGQQRLTTLSLLLLALRNVAREKGDEELADEIHETLLVHRHKKGNQRYKLVPRTGDREVYHAMLDDKHFDLTSPRLLTEGYEYFKKLVQTYCVEDASRLKSLFDTIINRLYLVVITLEQEDPYEIFDSLNSTGLPLEESDLIRNFLFMQVPLDEQDEFQSQCWQDFENSFDKDGLAINPTRFYREFLMRDGKYIKRDSVFSSFEISTSKQGRRRRSASNFSNSTLSLLESSQVRAMACQLVHDLRFSNSMPWMSKPPQIHCYSTY